METIYRLKASELNMEFVESIKELFKDEEIILSIVPARKTSGKKVKYAVGLLESIKNVEEGKVKTLSGKEFEKLTDDLLKNESSSI
jgi:hypothetical protein